MDLHDECVKKQYFVKRDSNYSGIQVQPMLAPLVVVIHVPKNETKGKFD